MKIKKNLITAIACTVILFGCRAASIDAGGVLSDKVETSKFLKAYENAPRVDISVDDEGAAYFIEIGRKGIKAFGIEVGDELNKSDIKKKLSGYKLDKTYGSDSGLVFISDTDNQYIFFESKDGDKISKIYLGLTDNDGIERLNELTEKTDEATEDSETTVANVLTTVEETVVSADFIIPDSSTRILTDDEVNTLDQNTARYALNEIYARRGRKFKDQELQNYFNGKSWYVGTIEPDNFDESSLTAIEKENTKKLDLRRNGKTVTAGATLPNAGYIKYFQDEYIKLGHQDVHTGGGHIKAMYGKNLGYGVNVYGRIYDRGDYYEFVNINLYTPYLYDSKPTDYMVEKTSEEDHDDYHGSYQLSNGKWVIYGDSDSKHSYVFYTGSIYMRKDAVIYSGRYSEPYEYKAYKLKDIIDDLSYGYWEISVYILELDENGYIKTMANQEWG